MSARKEGLVVKSINHVAVMVTDVERSRKFYEQLGLKKIPRPQTKVPGEWLGIGNNQLHLVGERAPEGRIDPRRPHMALDVENLEAAKATLTELGIKFVDASRQDVIPMTEDVLRLTGRQIWLEDPDGNMIELRQDYK
jgi:catechol 2,3-dioxygenase-like lactoylglutathione lyase family enzyme